MLIFISGDHFNNLFHALYVLRAACLSFDFGLFVILCKRHVQENYKFDYPDLFISF
jgi:hypothetical protein